jgi:hypothetical protein
MIILFICDFTDILNTSVSLKSGDNWLAGGLGEGAAVRVGTARPQ